MAPDKFIESTWTKSDEKLETTLRGTQAKLVDRDNEIGTSGGPSLIPSSDTLSSETHRFGQETCSRTKT